MHFSEIFKNCIYKGEKVKEGTYKGVFTCKHFKKEKDYCSMNCPIMKEIELVDRHMLRTKKD